MIPDYANLPSNHLDFGGFADTFEKLLVIKRAHHGLDDAHRIDAVERDAGLPDTPREKPALFAAPCGNTPRPAENRMAAMAITTAP